MNTFGSCSWTEEKLKILVEYAIPYLQIMKNRQWKTIYFDGFAGTGKIQTSDNAEEIIFGSTLRILSIENPVPFDFYYFVEKDGKKLDLLKEMIDDSYPNKSKNVRYAVEDCNIKLENMAQFLQSPLGKKYRVLAYIDPWGMQINWDSLEKIKGLGIDMWILVPTGIGVNRLLKRNGEIRESWIDKLQIFLGLNREEIVEHFYKHRTQLPIFDGESDFEKKEKAIQNSAELYKNRLKYIFKYVTEPYILRNSKKSIMYHFFMGSNYYSAYNIASDIIKKYNMMNNGTL